MELSLSRIFALGCVLAAGCNATPAAAPSDAKESADVGRAVVASASAPAPVSASPARVLAMTPPEGATPIDAEVRAAQAWVTRVPRSNDKLIELGRAWVQKARHSADPGYYLNAKACADLVLERDDKNRLARELLAQVALNQHKFVEAVDLCEQVLLDDKEAFITLGVYSDALLELGRIDEAVRAADRMVDFKPNSASYVRVSFLQWLRGDASAAIKTARYAIESANNPDKPEPKAYALVQTAHFFWHKGDYDGAEAGYSKATSVMPGYAPAMLGLARVALARGDAKRAAELAAIAEKESPSVEAAWRLGDARAALGDTSGADEAYARVIKRGRQSDPRTVAHFFAVKNRDVPEAVALAKEEEKARPGVYTQSVLAWALYRAGDLAGARAAIDKATQHKTPDAELTYHRGAILLATGDATMGKKLIADALAQSPKFDPTGAPEAEALLAK